MQGLAEEKERGVKSAGIMRKSVNGGSAKANVPRPPRSLDGNKNLKHSAVERQGKAKRGRGKRGSQGAQPH